MRWNCPHCEELVTAGIDFENTKKAYVRCAKCNGMALIHRSAVIADYVKARRMEEEAQLEAELRITQSASANSRVQAMENQIRGLNEKLTQTAMQAASPAPKSVVPPPPNAAMGMMMGLDMDSVASLPPIPPPFLSSFEPTDGPVDEITIVNDLSTPTPVFMYSNPPAFLLKSSAQAIETLERSFAIDGDIAPMEAITATPVAASASEEATPIPANEIVAAPSNIRPTIALWIAATLAIASGAYLYQEGKKALAPARVPVPAANPVANPAVADEIHSKANSAIRAETRAIAIVRVPRAVLRAAPSTESPPVQTVEKSTVATILESKDGWTRIESPKIETTSRTAWMRSDLVLQMPK
jgi:hypothetical protein